MSLKNTRFTAFLAVTAVAAITWRRMDAEREDRYEELRAGSDLIETEMGRVEVGRYGQGQSVLIVHGALGNYEHALNFSAPLTQQGVEIIAPSRPGHLRTDRHIGRTAAQQADMLVCLLDTMEIEQIPVVSISGGGPIAIAFAARHPERCTSLSLINAITHPFDPFRLGVIRAFDFLMKNTAAPDYLAWGVTRTILGTLPLWSRFKPEFVRMITSKPENLRLYKEAVRTFFPVKDVLPGFEQDIDIYAHADPTLMELVEAPTLVVQSKRSKSVPASHADVAVEKIANTEMLVLEGAGHAMHLTHAGQIWDRVAAFIEENSATETPPRLREIS